MDFQGVPPPSRRLKFAPRPAPGRCDTATRGSLIWTILERKIYENNWEANNIDHLVRRIKQKNKELDQQMLQDMMEGVRRKFRAIWRDGLYSIC